MRLCSLNHGASLQAKGHSCNHPVAVPSVYDDLVISFSRAQSSCQKDVVRKTCPGQAAPGYPSQSFGPLPQKVL